MRMLYVTNNYVADAIIQSLMLVIKEQVEDREFWLPPVGGLQVYCGPWIESATYRLRVENT